MYCNSQKIDISPLSPPVYEGGIVGSEAGLVVIQQSSYSQQYAKNSPAMGELNNFKSSEFPYGYRKRWITSFKTPDGNIIETDSFKNRLWRLRTALHSWVDIVESINSKGKTFDKKMITLTYAKAEDWQPKQITRYTKFLRRFLGDSLYSYAWVAELQERGAIHYHIVVYVESGVKVPHPDKPVGHKNFIAWSHGLSNVKTCKKPAYLVSYLGKEKQKDFHKFPLGARAYGVYVSLEFKSFVLGYKKFKMLPNWLQNNLLEIFPVDSETAISSAIDSKKIQINDLLNVQIRLCDWVKVYEKTKRFEGNWVYNDMHISKNSPSEILESLSKIGITLTEKGSFQIHRNSYNYEILDFNSEYFSDSYKPLSKLSKESLFDLGITRNPSSWVVEGIKFDSPCTLLSINQGNPSSWVDELKQMKQCSKNEVKINSLASKVSSFINA
jgi:hypothetical protein